MKKTSSNPPKDYKAVLGESIPQLVQRFCAEELESLQKAGEPRATVDQDLNEKLSFKAESEARQEILFGGYPLEERTKGFRDITECRDWFRKARAAARQTSLSLFRSNEEAICFRIIDKLNERLTGMVADVDEAEACFYEAFDAVSPEALKAPLLKQVGRLERVASDYRNNPASYHRFKRFLRTVFGPEYANPNRKAA